MLDLDAAAHGFDTNKYVIEAEARISAAGEGGAL
jgi:hypothetical protein